ncbi:MAG TPA: tRNA pseudouridine(55) synthase TruB [Ferruginibacter sp.]|nr:tRNA pseudouridine(55) synthase TruB [Ferruginibacter sp.]
MARRVTYRSKYAENTGEALPKRERREITPLDPAILLPFVEGKVLLIDKPLHWTSFDMVRKLRVMLHIKKIGHAGTLDPLATGLLIICTGKFTKKINDYSAQEKEYTGQITLGAVTATYDLESVPEQPKEYAHLTEKEIRDAAKKFVGEIEQMPPMYSAIKKDGVAMYELARKGVEIELKARKVMIYQFDITRIELPVVEFKILCSTGTYIRSIANDLGTALGCGAYLSSLRRTAIGEFSVADAIKVEDVLVKKDS